jgi:type II secretory pathway pseudopilin PulG
MSLKKGAMFGLDARIALAIFGALSVISGASLYSAIQESKITSLYVQLKEFEKAIESFMLDTGRKISSDSSWVYMSEIASGKEKLTTNDIDAWNGPYMPDESFGGVWYRFLGKSDKIEIVARSSFYNCTVPSFSGSSSDIKKYIQVFHEVRVSNADETHGYPYSFVKDFHDKYDNDGDYSNGYIIVSPETADSSRGCLYIKMLDMYT